MLHIIIMVYIGRTILFENIIANVIGVNLKC